MFHYLNTDCLFLSSCEDLVEARVSVGFNCCEFMAFLCYGVNATCSACTGIY